MRAFRICFVTFLQDLADRYAVPFRKLPDVDIRIVDTQDLFRDGLNASEHDVVVVSRLMAPPLWNLLVDVGRVTLDSGSRCVMSSILSAEAADDEARGLGFVAGIDLRQTPEKVVERLRTVWSGALPAPTNHPESILDRISDRTDLAIVALIAAGLSDKDISRWVFLSPQTVRNHVSRLLRDLGLANRTQLAIAYLLATNSTDGRIAPV